MKTMLLAATMVSLPTTAMAQSTKCATAAEAEALALATLPVLLEGAATRCRPLLPAGAWLSTSGRRLAERYRPDAEAAWPQAEAAARRLLGGELGGVLTSDALRLIVRQAIGELVQEELDAPGCTLFNEIAAPLEPLPARNMARLAVGLVKLGTKNEPELSKQIAICPEPAR